MAQGSYLRPPKWDWVPTGELTLDPGGRVDLTDDSTVATFASATAAEIDARLERTRESREQSEAAQRKEWERQQRAADHKRRVESMRKSATQLHEYRLLLEYIEEVRRVGRIPRDQLEEGQTLAEWLQWASRTAQTLHPLA